MLIPELKNALLFRITSGDNVDYSHVHESLCECAQKMLDKYEQEQEHNKKLGVKTQAVKVLLNELGKVPEDSSTTRDVILLALKKHAKVLQGYEHLLSDKGNTYELMKQTKGLREDHGALASLLRYHKLKNKFLGPDTLLSDERKTVLSELAENKGLTLDMLDSFEADPDSTFRILKNLREAGLLVPESDLCTRVFEHHCPSGVAFSLASLTAKGYLKPYLPDLFDAVFKCENPINIFFVIQALNRLDQIRPDLYYGVLKHRFPEDAVAALMRLNEAGLFESGRGTGVLEQENPLDAVQALERLKKAGLLKQELEHLVLKHNFPENAAKALEEMNEAGLLEQGLEAGVLKHRLPAYASMAMVKLNKAGLLKQGLEAGVLKHKFPEGAARALLELHQHKLYTPDSFFQILKHFNPYGVVLAITKLHSCHMLTDVNRDQILNHRSPNFVATVFEHLGELLCTQDNIDAVINYPDILKLVYGIEHLKVTEKLDQSSFKDFLETGYAAKR